MIATNGQTITGATVDATGCDIGIYVGSAINSVTITDTTVSGANNEGILAEDNTGLTITGSTIQDNGAAPTPKIPDGHALMLDGVVSAMITNNTISNNADGGIGLADNGPVDPGTPNPGPPPRSRHRQHHQRQHPDGQHRWLRHRRRGLGPGRRHRRHTVQNNTVTGTSGKFGPNGPDIGQIVVADDAAGASVTNTTINGNTVSQSFVIGHHAARQRPARRHLGHHDHQQHADPDNNWGFANAAPSTDAIALIVESFPGALAASISGTSISGNTITNQVVAIWIRGATTTTVGANSITLPAGGTAVYNVPTAGGGYWMAGSDGGVFAFGNAMYYGSAPGLGLKLQPTDRGHGTQP